MDRHYYNNVQGWTVYTITMCNDGPSFSDFISLLGIKNYDEFVTIHDVLV